MGKALRWWPHRKTRLGLKAIKRTEREETTNGSGGTPLGPPDGIPKGKLPTTEGAEKESAFLNGHLS